MALAKFVVGGECDSLLTIAARLASIECWRLGVEGADVGYDPKVIGPRFISWLEEDVGKDDITLNTKLSDIGFDGYNIFSLGQQIDQLSWLHGVNITPKQIVKCKTVNDIVTLICS